MNAQFRLFDRLKKEKKPRPMKTAVDLPLSTEMIDWLDETCNRVDDDGYLADDVGSMLTQPLDSFSTYCPTGAIVTSKYSSTRIPSPLKPNTSQTTFGLSSFFPKSSGTSESLSTYAHESQSAIDYTPSNPVKINEAVTSLNIMWLKRKASLEVAAGHGDAALQFLDQALNLHLGTTNYADAKLSEHIVSADPTELLDIIDSNYVLYDQRAHLIAARIQRWYDRYYQAKCKAQVMASKHYRGYLGRRMLWRIRQLRMQCAQLIQFRFRAHLRRLHALATKLKQWYKVRCEVREYKRRLKFYQMARRIQRLFRGNRGRERAARKRFEKLSFAMLQRNSRGFMSRRERSFAVMMYHRLFYRAARTIQCMVRCVQAVQRAQLQLLLELSREEERVRKERKLVGQTLKLETSRTKLYIQTEPGRLHVALALNRIRLKDKHFSLGKKSLTEEEILAWDAMVAFELFDKDGSGQLDIDELSDLLRELSIPSSRRKLKLLMKELNPDETGEVDFGTFIAWYCRKGASKRGGSSASCTEATLRSFMLFRHWLHENLGIIQNKRAEREVIRDCTSWRCKDVTANFRASSAPKFQCCQCLKPFVMFTDYYAHFVGEGKCGVLGLPGMFYPQFWKSRDWKMQRECEYEIMRMNDELPCVHYHASKAVFADKVYQRDRGVRRIHKRFVKAARHKYMDILKADSRQSMAALIFEAVDICQLADLDPLLAYELASCLGKNLPIDWIVEDHWDMQALQKWLGESGCSPSLARRLVVCSKYGQRWLDAHVVAKATVGCLRQMQVSAEASLVALLAYRCRRGRRLSIADEELVSKGMPFLTASNYYRTRDKLLHKLRVVNAALDKLLMIQPPRCFGYGDKLVKYLRIGLDGNLTPEAIQKLIIADEHIRAKAMYRSWLRCRAGKLHLRRLTRERWATRHLIMDKHRNTGQDEVFAEMAAVFTSIFKDLVGVQKWQQEAEFEYLIGRYLSIALHKSGVDLWDWLLLQHPLHLRVPEKDESSVTGELDPTERGYLDIDGLRSWLISEAAQKHPHWSLIRTILHSVTVFACYLTNQLYQYHAKEALLISFRVLARTKLQFLHECDLVYTAAHERALDIKNPDAGEQPIEGLGLGSRRKSGLLSGNTKPASADGKPNDLNVDAAGNAKSSNVAEAPSVSSQTQGWGDAERQADIKLETSLSNLVNVMHAHENAELQLLCRMAEDEAEWRCWQQLFLSRRGRQRLLAERVLMREAGSMMTAMGHCIPPAARDPWTVRMSNYIRRLRRKYLGRSNGHGVASPAADDDGFCNSADGESPNGFFPVANAAEMISERSLMPEGAMTGTARLGDEMHDAGWGFALSVIVHVFDTDCSGTFDEGEVRLLLDSLKCHLPERKLLHRFPELMQGSSDLDSVVSFLVTRVHWRRWRLWGKMGELSLSRRSNFHAAAFLLISRSRQEANELTRLASTLLQTGRLPQEQDGVDERALLVRSQLLAMRQVQAFLRTTYGRLKRKVAQDEVLHLWKSVAVFCGFTLSAIIRFAYHIHRDPVQGLLVTELPHVVHFLVAEMKLKPNEGISKIANMVSKVCGRKDLMSFSERDTVALLVPIFNEPPTGGFARLFWRSNLVLRRSFMDAKFRMLSLARQQAVLISMRFTGAFVADTNYRCCILGLYTSMDEVKYAMKDENVTRLSAIKVDWLNVPTEAVTLLLLSRGFAYSDLFRSPISRYACIDHSNGSLGFEKVYIQDALETATESNKASLSTLVQIERWVRFFGGMSKYVEYRKIVKHLSDHSIDIRMSGGTFLNEILTGISARTEI